MYFLFSFLYCLLSVFELLNFLVPIFSRWEEVRSGGRNPLTLLGILGDVEV